MSITTAFLIGLVIGVIIVVTVLFATQVIVYMGRAADSRTKIIKMVWNGRPRGWMVCILGFAFWVGDHEWGRD